MAMDIKNSSTSSGLDQSIEVQTTDNQEVDRAGEKETTWQNPNWTTYNGYYKTHNAVKSVIDKVGMWTVGKGYKADKRTTNILDKVRGWGKETFNEVMDNLIRVMYINGDSYAEIIRDSNGKLINLKPLNPTSVKHILNPKGMLTGYKQQRVDGTEHPMELDDVFHLTMGRTADEIHGTGAIQPLMTFLDKIKQLDEDMSVMFHRYVVPMIIWRLNTDDSTAIANFKAHEASAFNKGQNLVTPELAVGFELIEAGKNGVDPMEWRNKWIEEVIKGGGVPALIMAIEAGTTEASSKMVYLAWQQVIEYTQLKLENQVLAQLTLTIKYEFPARIEENLGEDEGKDGGINQTKKSEVTINTKQVGGEKTTKT